MNLDSKKIDALIKESLQEVLSFQPGRGAGAVLYGPDGTCDSISLVHLIAHLEKKILATSGKKISLASPKAFSREKSPFRTTDSLREFVEELMHG